ncbi:MAG: chemotaxis protein CheW [Thermodesulfobacteriota bacterium]|nr:chemotaxis protein CheW [Thermodesulfobacteriota bacterium]
MADIKQYLTFVLGGENFALETSRVKEVLEYTTITRIPRMPDFLCGVINLRGNVVPVMDMRLKLGMPSAGRTVDTCIVIVEVDFDDESATIGCLVDSVKEVLEIAANEIEPPPKMGMRLGTDFIQGMARQGESFIIILDINRIIAAEDIMLLQGAAGKGADSPMRNPAEECVDI